MFKIRKLEIEDLEQLNYLIKNVEENIKNQLMWLPIKEEAKIHFFDKNWTVFFGCFVDDKLVGASALFLNKFEFEESAKQINLETENIAEIGRCMVLLEYRGNNIMYIINQKIIEYARHSGINTLIATAHPDNVASNTSLQKLGMKIVKCYLKENKFLRNILVLNLSN